MNVLNVTSLIRHSLIDKKKTENRILFDIDSEFRRSPYDVSFSYLYLHPYSNKFLKLFKKEWKQYYTLRRMKTFSTLGFFVFTFPVFILPFKTILNGILFCMSTIVFRKRIDDVIRKCKPDIIQAHDVEQSAFVARYISKKYNIPYILSPRGIHYRKFKYNNKNIVCASALISHGYLQFTAVNEEFEDKVNLLIPHGVDNNLFVDSEKCLHSIDKIRIVSIGRLLGYKKFDVLIKAVSKFNNIELDIYGDGVERNNLNLLIDSLNIGHRVNLITEPFENLKLPSIFKNYNIFALLAYPETFGRVFAEAVVCGLPIIGARETGLYGQLKPGSNGFFVDPKDSMELEKSLEYILNNPHVLNEIAENNLKIREKYSWKVILGQYYTLYKSIGEKKNEK